MKNAKTNVLNELHRIASQLEDKGLEVLASHIDEVFSKVAEADEALFDKNDDIPAEMNLEDAINNYDSNVYKVDVKGNWEKSEWMTIPEFFEHLSEEDLKAPASVDDNHIVVHLPNVGTQVINMVPKQHWDEEEVKDGDGAALTEDDLNEAGNRSEEVKEFHKRMMKETGQISDENEIVEADVVEFKNDVEEDEASSTDFRRSLEAIINQHSMENGSDTPDFILAEYLEKCMEAFDAMTKKRSEWYNGKDKAGNDNLDFTAEAARIADENQLYAIADILDQKLA
jgi:hypothetical protein